MQKDYMGMMQGQAAPAQEQLSPEEEQAIQEFGMTDEDYSEMGMTPGATPEAFKQRVIEMLDRFDLLEGMSNTEKMQLMAEVDRFVQDLISGNTEAASQNPVNQLMMSAEEEMGSMNQQLEGFEEEGVEEQDV
jgi:hypothetical protein